MNQLCLNSGEIIKMSPEMTMMFEVSLCNRREFWFIQLLGRHRQWVHKLCMVGGTNHLKPAGKTLTKNPACSPTIAAQTGLVALCLHLGNKKRSDVCYDTCVLLDSITCANGVCWGRRRVRSIVSRCLAEKLPQESVVRKFDFAGPYAWRMSRQQCI